VADASEQTRGKMFYVIGLWMFFCQKNSAKKVLEFKSQGTRLRQFLLVSEEAFLL
jgi:hypothetical protein